MKKLLVLSLLSLVAFIATSLYVINIFASVDESVPAQELADELTLPISISAISAVVFWASIIIAGFIFLKKHFRA